MDYLSAVFQSLIFIFYKFLNVLKTEFVWNTYLNTLLTDFATRRIFSSIAELVYCV